MALCRRCHDALHGWQKDHNLVSGSLSRAVTAAVIKTLIATPVTVVKTVVEVTQRPRQKGEIRPSKKAAQWDRRAKRMDGVHDWISNLERQGKLNHGEAARLWELMKSAPATGGKGLKNWGIKRMGPKYSHLKVR